MENEGEFLSVLSYKRGKFCLRKDGLIEGFVDTGIEIDEKLAEDYSDFLAHLAPQTTGLLIHKKNSYSLTFEGQRVLGRIPNIIATALLAYSDVARLASISQKPIMGNPKHKVEVFDSYDRAIDWLHEQVKQATSGSDIAEQAQPVPTKA